MLDVPGSRSLLTVVRWIFVCSAIIGNLLLLVLMTTIKPPQYEVNIVQSDRFDQTIETYGFCVWEEAAAFLAPLTALNTCTVLLSLYEAWKSRSLTTEFAESKYIGRAVAGTLIVGGIGLPILIIARDNSDASLFVSSGIIFVTVRNTSPKKPECICFVLIALRRFSHP